jgi:hypothetical protein
MDYTFPKDSNEILFAQIRVAELFIWILQDLYLSNPKAMGVDRTGAAGKGFAVDRASGAMHGQTFVPHVHMT